ncbi:hypothetical protein L6164_036850 [Bauhinia variegata]|uniref:Uncharacterized protein n=1 Tax=Bauhinia variegata TaxID=167791 RepID=A0ACB9KIA9_BAUVA|nr:hypothetical protein L6164_036850 [Bauhinia variegata]
MAGSQSCISCRNTSLFRDDVSGDLICSSCGVLQPYDQFEAQIGGLTGPTGTFVRVGTAGTGSFYTYKERKVLEAHRLINEFTTVLGIPDKNGDVKAMISDITKGEFGQGDWFQVLIGACSYVVMRQVNCSLPMAEVVSAVGCDVFELGKMIQRVTDFLDLKKPEFPEFDIVNSLERTLKNSPSFYDIERSKMDIIRKQGIFLIQCAVKWFLSTGRRPLPLVVAVLVFVAELNQVEVRIEDLANEVHAVISTCRTRYKELLEALVKVAQALPWGKDINVKNIVKNAPFIMQYMERKSMSKSDEKRKNLGQLEVNLADVVSECLRRDDHYGDGTDVISSRNNSQYLLPEGNGYARSSTENVDRLRISPECLSMVYDKFLSQADHANTSRGNRAPKRKRLQFDFEDCSEWWSGKSELSKKLLLQQLLEKDVGLDVAPPSFTTGCLKCKRRREKINAAKQRINRIMHPLHTDLGDSANLSVTDVSHRGKWKKRKGATVDDVDWEDLIIETLLLHQVKEEEIEKGHYNTLMDLHVFNSGIV